MRTLAELRELAKQLPKPVVPSWDEQQERVQAVLRQAPAVVESPSFRHFSPEEKQVIRNVLGTDPNAGWHGDTPIWTPKYEYLHSLTKMFAPNGQPPEVERHRVWKTSFEKCEVCGAPTAKWIDRYHLTAGYSCDGCHKDYPLGSYLQLELERKAPNAVVSSADGFLGEDPLFSNFELWEPGMATLLAAAMGTGKSTEIGKASRRRVDAYKAAIIIIGVPRVPLARFSAYRFREADGHGAWGLWHEGVNRSDKFIGTIGVICCLPSLPRVLSKIVKDGGCIENVHLAIDEVDFGCQLFDLVPETAVSVKEALRTCVENRGIVVAGQTEYTLAFDQFCAEIGATSVKSFYKAAPPTENTVELRFYPDVEGKMNQLVAGAGESIDSHLRTGKNVYGFFSSRREAEIIAEVFKSYNPVLYTGKSKGDPRADAVLLNQRLTDSQLFLATSVAGIGLSIHDPEGVTEIVSSLNFGSRDPCMLVQKGIRNRYRRDITYHLTEYHLPLPVRPSKSENVSLFHEKQKEFASVYPEAVHRGADVYALNSLADAQIQTFFRHHFENVMSMSVVMSSAMPPLAENIEGIQIVRRNALEKTRNEKRAMALKILESRDVLSAYQIRVASNRGQLLPMPILQIAHEAANAALQGVGWGGEFPRQERGESDFDYKQRCREIIGTFDLEVAKDLVAADVDFDRLVPKRDGYMAVHFQETAYQLASERSAHVESTAVQTPVFRGTFLRALLETTLHPATESELAGRIKAVLRRKYKYSTFIDALLKGALGVRMYRQCRFLMLADDARMIDWARNFIGENYPARLGTRGDLFSLVPSSRAALYLKSFQAWIREIADIPVPDSMPLVTGEGLPDPLANQKILAIRLKKQGTTVKEIAEQTGLSLGTVSKVTAGVRKDMRAAQQVEARRLREDGWSYKRIAEKVGVKSARTIAQWFKK